MLVKDVMSRNPVVIGPEKSVLDAKECMDKNKVATLPVIDKSGSLVGVVSKADLAASNPSKATTLDMFELGYLLSKVTVEKIMVKHVKTITENETVEEAASIMSDYGISSLPVLDGNVVAGIVTRSDIFDSFIKMFSTKNAGVRAVIEIDEKPGQLAKLAAGIAEKNGNIVSLVTLDSDDSSKRKVTVKACNVSEDVMKSIIAGVGGKLEDIRSV